MKLLSSPTARSGVLVLLGILGSFLSVVAMGVGPSEALWPRFSTVLIFYTLVRWPDLLSAQMLFVLGLVQDLIIGNIFGAGMVALILTGLALEGWIERTNGAPVLMEWFRFMPFVAIVFTLEWGLTSAGALQAAPGMPAIGIAAMTFGAYGMVTLLAHGIAGLRRSTRNRRGR